MVGREAFDVAVEGQPDEFAARIEDCAARVAAGDVVVGEEAGGQLESLSSDLRYNPQLQRCINADIRYILFVIDTYGGSHYLINEMDIRR